MESDPFSHDLAHLETLALVLMRLLHASTAATFITSSTDDVAAEVVAATTTATANIPASRLEHPTNQRPGGDND